MTQPEGSIPLADLIDAVRGELEESAGRALNQDLQFEVQEVNLEVEVVTTGTREGQGGLQIWVLTLGSSVPGRGCPRGSRAGASDRAAPDTR